jgi:glutathione S-transferase
MTSPNPTLYVFAISHYCEKARWALDQFGIHYRLQHTVPGLNRAIAKRLGAASGSLPFLATNNGAIAGSGAIIDWGEARRAAGRASLAGSDPAKVLEIESRLDQIAGVHIRRYYYSDALLSDPGSVRPIFSRDLALLPRLAVTLGWSKIVPRMIAGMDLGPAQGLQSRDKLLGELDWLDRLLADGRAYLTGDQFTRADLTAASLLAPLVNPPQHPTYAGLAMPPALAQEIAAWRERPALQWVSAVYASNR